MSAARPNFRPGLQGRSRTWSSAAPLWYLGIGSGPHLSTQTNLSFHLHALGKVRRLRELELGSDVTSPRTFRIFNASIRGCGACLASRRSRATGPEMADLVAARRPELSHQTGGPIIPVLISKRKLTCSDFFGLGGASRPTITADKTRNVCLEHVRLLRHEIRPGVLIESSKTIGPGSDRTSPRRVAC